ncbi:hypothetical protein C0J52_21013 [Blattella germanica]|nr:hypothetical protein C0J52_21013 [Blattella germanica]
MSTNQCSVKSPWVIPEAKRPPIKILHIRCFIWRVLLFLNLFSFKIFLRQDSNPSKLLYRSYAPTI